MYIFIAGIKNCRGVDIAVVIRGIARRLRLIDFLCIVRFATTQTGVPEFMQIQLRKKLPTNRAIPTQSSYNSFHLKLPQSLNQQPPWKKPPSLLSLTACGKPIPTPPTNYDGKHRSNCSSPPSWPPNVPHFTDPKRVADLVACFSNWDAGGEPWAIILEFQTEPDAKMIGRINVYGGSFWIAKKPDEERGSRYRVGGLVVLLTGSASDDADEHWECAGVGSLRVPKVFPIGEKSATAILSRIDAGKLGLAILVWIPLMQGGDQADIMEQWKTLGERETDKERKTNLGTLAQLFSEKAGCASAWKEALKEWNVEESTIFKEWTIRAAQLGEERGIEIGEKRGLEIGEKRGLEIGERKALVEMAKAALTQKFGDEGEELFTELDQVEDLERLRSLALAVFRCEQVEEFRDLLRAES